MKMNEEFRRFEEDLKKDPELRKKYDEAIQNLDISQLKSDGEIIARAASQLGYDISVAELERAHAAMQEVDPDEMEHITGGADNPLYKPMEGDLCLVDYNCIGCYQKRHIDGDNHNEWCYASWHCYTAFMHTNSNDDAEAACWSDYTCVAVNN